MSNITLLQCTEDSVDRTYRYVGALMRGQRSAVHNAQFQEATHCEFACLLVNLKTNYIVMFIV